MDPIRENDPVSDPQKGMNWQAHPDPLSDNDINRIQNLSLEGHNQKLNLEADEFKNQFKDSLLTNFGGDNVWTFPEPKYSPTSTCCCGVPMNHSDHKFWTSPEPKLYSATEDPTRKKYSPLSGPIEYTYTPTKMCKDDANSN